MGKATLIGLLLGLGLAAAPVHGGAVAGVAVYPMRGVFRGVDPATGQATVAHDAVNGYMPAMTMNFDLAAPDEMRGLRPGDTFTCQLRVTDDRAWIEEVHRENVPSVPLLGVAARARRSTELAVGDPLPDIEMTDQRGETVRLRDFGGKPLAISFIYLRCVLPTYCPLLNRNFQIARGLLDRLGLQGQARFLSVSMDPEHDTPKSLAAYAGAFEADPSAWIFAAVPEASLRRLGDAVGLEFQQQGGVINHNLRTVVVDGRARIRRVFRGNTWTPQELVSELRAAATAQD